MRTIGAKQKLFRMRRLLSFWLTATMCIIIVSIHRMILMRTNIVIDDKLMSDALKSTGIATKKEAVEQGLKLLIQHNKQQAIRKLRGKLNWEGDLDEMRGRK
jgi:Arc/MetJ family transcription regulator